MTEAMPFLQKFDITFLRPPPITDGDVFLLDNMFFYFKPSSSAPTTFML